MEESEIEKEKWRLKSFINKIYLYNPPAVKSLNETQSGSTGRPRNTDNLYIFRTESDFVSPNCYGETTERCQCQCMRNEHALV